MKDKRELTRSELVRQRRRQQEQKRLTNSSTLVTRPLPPVVSREGMNLNASPWSAKAGTRRGYQAAFSMPGIQVRVPAAGFTRGQAGWRLVSLFFALILGTLIYLSATLPMFRVTGAQVQGNQRLTPDEINTVLQVGNQPIITLAPDALEAKLRSNFPELTSARVSLSLPNHLVVDVVERQPAIVWQVNGSYTWIDNTGVAFRPRGTADHLIVVVALGTPPTGQASTADPQAPLPFLSMDLVKSIQVLAPSLPAGTSLIYDPVHGLGWADSRGWKVFFGSDSKTMPMKLQVYQSLLNSLLQRSIYPAFISVEYVNAPYYRMSQ